MKNKNLKLLPVILGFGCASLLLAGCSGSSATAKSKEKNRAEYPLFSNPVIYSDVPDVAVTRAGDDFYMVSTTMHLMPGAPVMKSKDLVNWEIASYLYDRIEDSPNYDLADGKTVYGQGQWASSIRYHKGKFYVLFCTNNPSRAYIYTTDDPSGKWEKYATIPQFHDPSLFFDDDDQVYIFYNSGEIVQLNEDLQSVKEGGLRKRLFDRDETENALLEGSQVIKHNGKYYLLMISWPQNSLRRQVCYRADNIEGPYEKRVILEHNFQNFGGVGQGCLIDTEDGDWYAMIFQDRGGIGRVPNLMPCRWVDGWPMLGDENGHVPVEMNSPVKGDVAVEPIIKSDNFTADYLGKNWQWNHNPDNEAWSLTERPGYLRLKTSRVVDNIFTAPNTISQRTEGPKCTGVVAMDISGMKDGDVAGFSAFNGHSGLLSVIKDGKNNYLTMSTNVVNLDYQNERKVKSVDEEIFETVEIPQDKVYLRIDCDFLDRRDIATFYYSLDNENWSKIGTDFKMRFDYMKLFMGTRYAIFNYAGKSTGGYVDIESFDFEKTL